jgi:hypothetical protein
MRRTAMKKKFKSIVFLASNSLLIIFILVGNGCLESMPTEELQASIELVDVDTRWEEKYYQPWPPKLILVPAISFKIKNVGNEPLEYIYCNGIFRFIDENKNLGDNFVAGIRGNPVMPGEISDVISLQSFHGVEGKNLAHFKNNPAWKKVSVKVFMKSKGSQYVLIDEHEISKKINFKEPEPVGMEQTEKQEEKKK